MLLLLPLVMMCSHATAQERPKVGLVLSGGGARGMAHIGVLKAMEAAGLRPDVITGTSMGSIVGGLYAMGYSASELERIVGDVDWDELLSNTLPLNEVVMEEKPWYGRYILEFPAHDLFRISLPGGLIEGQQLGALLFDLTRPVHDLDDFNDLPIPFACVATDIATGKPVVLNKGSLARSLRASMSIPTVFTPVEINDKLLVDGGLVRNFPVQEAIDMGADIIIGVFVSADLEDKNHLKSWVSILLQSTWVLSAYDTREQMKRVDLLIEPDLRAYSTGSFKLSNDIIAQGERDAASFAGAFKRLADSLNAIGPQPPIAKPVIAQDYEIRRVEIAGNSTLSDGLIRARLRIPENARLSAAEIERQVELLFGVGWFENVGYELQEVAGGHDLLVTVREAPPAKVKFAIHYDSENKTGVNINYTLRNTLFKSSRLLAEIDLAEFPRVRFNYLKYIGRSQDFAASIDFAYNSFSPPIPITDGTDAIFSVRQYDLTASVFRTARANRTYGFAVSNNFINLKPRIGDALLTSFDYVKNSGFSGRFFWMMNTLERPYYPRRGTRASAAGSLVFNSKGSLLLALDSATIQESYEISDIAKIELDYLRLQPLSKAISVVGQARLTVANDEQRDVFHVLGLTYGGGFLPRIQNSMPFYGAKNYAYAVSSFFMANLAVQAELVQRVYLTAGVNTLTTEYPMRWLDENYVNIGDLNEDDLTYRIGYGLSLGYLSLIGPVSVSMAADSRSGNVYGNFNFGFYF